MATEAEARVIQLKTFGVDGGPQAGIGWPLEAETGKQTDHPIPPPPKPPKGMQPC